MADRGAGQGSALSCTVLGCRGSMAVAGPEVFTFGGSTSSYLVEAAGETLILDAGTGILDAPVTFAGTPTILLSHLHLDHLMGLGMYRRLFAAGTSTRLLVPFVGSSEEARSVLARLYSPPLWPVTLEQLSGDVLIEEVRDSFRLGPVLVETFAGNHPGGCLVVRVSHAGSVLVYATDYEVEPHSFARLVDICSGADLVLFDGQYREEELELRRGFGHSTAGWGCELARRSGAARVLLIHHDPASTDEELLSREARLADTCVRYARQGEVIEL